jgi:outer membrane protein assembly factor BamB
VYTIGESLLIGGEENCYLLNPRTWKEITYPLEKSTLGVTRTTLFAATPDDALDAIEVATGRIRWNIPRPSGTLMFLALTSGTRVFVLAPYSVLAADAGSGELTWIRNFNDYETDVNFATLRKTTLFLSVSGSVPDAGLGGRVIALDTATGQPRWTANVIDNPFAPVAAHGVVFVPTGGGTVYALDATSGNTLWIRPTDGQPSKLLVT